MWRWGLGIGDLCVRESHFIILKAHKDLDWNDCEGFDNAALVAMETSLMEVLTAHFLARGGPNAGVYDEYHSIDT